MAPGTASSPPRTPVFEPTFCSSVAHSRGRPPGRGGEGRGEELLTEREAAAVARLLRVGIPVGFLEALAQREEERSAARASDGLRIVIHRSRGRVVELRIGRGDDRIPLTDSEGPAHTSG